MRQRLGVSLTVAVLLAAMLTAGAALADGASSSRAGRSRAAGPLFTSHLFANGAMLSHRVDGHSEQLSDPDDITELHGFIYVGFQNGVGPQGEKSPTGGRDSTVVKFDAAGHDVKQWELVGKCDGLTADPLTGRVIATVNEDANSHVYLIDPAGAAVRYRYNRNPLPSGGGTDAIEIYHRMVLISASAPGTTGTPAPQATYPAVYRVRFDAGRRLAKVTPLFFDEDFAREANTTSPQRGELEHLGLTDPDSNEVVPRTAHRFAGDFMLTSQGDEEQIFVSRAASRRQTLSVLQLSASVDDTQWAAPGGGSLYADSTSLDTVDRVTGPFASGAPYVAITPCDEDSAPMTCPGPGYPNNSLGRLNPDTGMITPLRVAGPLVEPQGMLFER